MTNSKRLYANTAILTGSSIVMSLISMSFQVWLASRIGASGIGLYGLISSVSYLCISFAVSGIRFTSTRLVAEELGLGRQGGAKAAMKRCIAYALFFGTAAMLILSLTAEPLGFLWIGDARTVKPLRIVALSMPFISISSAMCGYFTACGRVWKSSLVSIIEELSGIALVAVFLLRSPVGDIEANCSAVMLGSLISDVFSFSLMLVFFVSDREVGASGTITDGMTGRMLKLALPLAVSAYTRSALSTVEHLLVPRGLKASGLSADRALSAYGTVQGMVMPVFSFPACILIAVSELIVPELTAAQMQNDSNAIRKTVSKLIKKSLGYSLTVALILFIFAKQLGAVIYSSSDAGFYLRLLAPLIPVMYTDTVVDGCLKGLGQQVWSMAINILDATVGVVLVWSLLPKYAMTAYIAILYFNECLNFTLSCLRLSKAVRLSPQAQGRTGRRL